MERSGTVITDTMKAATAIDQRIISINTKTMVITIAVPRKDLCRGEGLLPEKEETVLEHIPTADMTKPDKTGIGDITSTMTIRTEIGMKT